MKRREDKNSGLKSTERGNSLQVSNGCAGNSCSSFYILHQLSFFLCQVSTLRAALDQMTQEKSRLRDELARERTKSSQLSSQLAESGSKCRVKDQHLKERERECARLNQV